VRYTRTARIEQVDDHYVARIYTGPIAYRDSAGQWQPIDNTLVASSDGSHYTNRANSYTVSFPVSLALGPIHIQTSSGSIDLAPGGTTGPGTVSGRRSAIQSAGVRSPIPRVTPRSRSR
jgi:hypothetical protein